MTRSARSFVLSLGLLGALGAGCAPAPLDRDLPQEPEPQAPPQARAEVSYVVIYVDGMT